MINKVSQHFNRGMNRDLSDSKVSNEFAYENYNIRITENDGDTSLSVTNEKGNVKCNIYNEEIKGLYCGHCVVLNYIVLFTNENGTNHIYRIDLLDNNFISNLLYSGNLGIIPEYPVECIADYQTENIIKVYWTDGINQPRVINILEKDTSVYSDTYFDFAKTLGEIYTTDIYINRYSSGEFASGVIQYFITGVDKNGIESSILCQSKLINLINKDRALSETENFLNSITIRFESQTNQFDKYILYSIQRVSENTEPIARKVQEFELDENNVASIEDTGNIGESISASDLLYKGSEVIVAQTMANKDNTLFLGNIEVKTAQMSDTLITLIKDQSNYNVSESYDSHSRQDYGIAYPRENGIQQSNPYLRKGNYYRVGIQFKDKYGKWSNAFYICDKQIENKIVFTNTRIDYPILSVGISNSELISKLQEEGFVSYRVLLVLPDDTDKVVLAEGIINQNVLNIGDNDKDVSNADSSWFFRPITRGKIGSTLLTGDQEFRPYTPLQFANNLGAEIQSQNYRDYMYAYDHEQRDLAQYMINPIIQDFYSPDIDSIQYSNLSYNSIVGNVIGYAQLSDTYKPQLNSRATVNDPVGVIPIKSGYKSKNEKYNVRTGFFDGFYAEEEDLTNLSKYYLLLVLGSSASAGLNYAVYPWNRDSSLNNDYAREGRTAILNHKVFSKYNYFRTTYLSSPVQFDLDSDLYYFDNSVDYLILKDNTNKQYKYRGNLNTIVAPKRYATPIYIAKYDESTRIVFGDLDTTSTPSGSAISVISGRSRRTSQSVQVFDSYYLTNDDNKTPIELIDFDGYGLEETAGGSVAESYSDANRWAKDGSTSTTEYQTETTVMSSMDPVSIKYKTPNHGVFVLKKPIWFNSEQVVVNSVNSWFSGLTDAAGRSTSVTLDTIPVDVNVNFPILWVVEFKKKSINQDTIFGGKSDFAIKNNNWIIASNEYEINSSSNARTNTGDTYFYRWDVLKTFPYTNEDKNSVVEIGSFLIQSYRNLQGRYDKNIFSDDYTIMNDENFGLYNDVYNQKNNFISYRYLPDDYLENNKFPNQFVWTLEHTPGADIDNWTNISYGSFYNVNGANGEIRAIRRYGDSLLGFQDSGIFEIMFNSRTQISTTNGMPIELANSGKVDGVRYLTDKEGCVNKWSIKVTPGGLYFIDDLNYSINVIAGSSIKRLSEELGFSQWCKDNIIPYKGWDINNGGFITSYDRIQNDVYFSSLNKSLVYSEKLGQFMSFMDYPSSYVLDNIDDKFISISSDLWENRAGNYNSFFGGSKDYFVKYRIAPDPYLNKTFHTIDYIATGNNFTSNYTDLFVEGVNQSGHEDLTLRGGLPPYNLQKKFNIWRANIPRDSNNRLNRIQSPWIYLTLKSDANKRATEDRIELHNMLVKYSV